MDPDQNTPAEPVPAVPENPEPAPATETLPPEPITAPETPTIPSTPPNPPEPQPVVETPVATPSAETPPPQVEQPSPIPIVIPIPNFRFPFNGDFPVTFPFNVQPTTDEMKGKFAQWGISGHHGIDFGLPEGTEVVAVDAGTVLQSSENGDYGNSVTIQHPWGQSLYAHLKETKVTEDQEVKDGDLIGLSGQTGAAFGAHLHFGIKPNNPDQGNGYLGFVDPSSYLPPIPQISPIPPTPPITPPVEPSKPEEIKPVVETPPIPEPTINIEPVTEPEPQTPPEPSQPPPPLPAEAEAKVGPEPVVDETEIQQRAEELLKEKQQTYRVLGNQAKTKEREDNLTKIMQFAQGKKQIDNQQVRDLLHVSQSTATNYLTELVNKGQLRIDKKGKATIYLY